MKINMNRMSPITFNFSVMIFILNFLSQRFSVSNNERQKSTDKSFFFSKVPQARNISHENVLLLLLLYISILRVIKSSFREKDLSRKIKLN